MKPDRNDPTAVGTQEMADASAANELTAEQSSFRMPRGRVITTRRVSEASPASRPG